MPMMIFDPFWRMMNEREISTYSLEVDYGLNKAFIHRLKHNKNMNLSSIDYICEVFRCSVEDVVVHIRNDNCAGKKFCPNEGKIRSGRKFRGCYKWQITVRWLPLFFCGEEGMQYFSMGKVLG